jgi:hypothetical protein
MSEGGIMFCDGCGEGLQGSQNFCPKCGKEVREGIHLAYPRPNRVQEHVRLLGILWLAMAALNAVGGLVLLIVANTIFFPGAEPVRGPIFLHPLLTVVSTLILIKASASFAAGLGLLQRQPWARILTLILAVLSLFSPPFGTALGVYTLWVLLPAESERQYEEQVRAASVPVRA